MDRVVALSNEEIDLLITVLSNAAAEVDAAANPGAMVRPDDPDSLMRSYNRAKVIKDKLEGAKLTEPKFAALKILAEV